MGLTNPCTGQEIINEINKKINTSGDTMTGHLFFDNANEYHAIEKTRILSDNKSYNLTLGIGNSGQTVLEHYYDGNLDGRLELTGAGLKWKNGSNPNTEGYREHRPMPVYVHTKPLSFNSNELREFGIHYIKFDHIAGDAYNPPTSCWGVLISYPDGGTPFQLYYPDLVHAVYKRYLDRNNTTWKVISSVVSGYFSFDLPDGGRGFFNLGFTPSWVLVMPSDRYDASYSSAVKFGLATSNVPACGKSGAPAIQVTTNGFYVYSDTGDKVSIVGLNNYIAGR